MFLSEIAGPMWLQDGLQLCSEPGCGVHDGAVGPCDHCNRPTCLEHSDVLMNRDIDSDLILCQSCGDEFDRRNGLTFDDRGHPQIHGPPWRREAELVRPQPSPHRRLQAATG